MSETSDPIRNMAEQIKTAAKLDHKAGGQMVGCESYRVNLHIGGLALDMFYEAVYQRDALRAENQRLEERLEEAVRDAANWEGEHRENQRLRARVAALEGAIRRHRDYKNSRADYDIDHMLWAVLEGEG